MGKMTVLRDFFRTRIIDYRLLFAALIFACMALLATWKINQEIAQRRVHDPVETVGTLRSAKCGIWRHNNYAYLVYEYAAHGSPTRHDHATERRFETTAGCQEFIQTMTNFVPVWYESSRPDLATFDPKEPDSWVSLILLFPSAILFKWGISTRRPINKRMKKTRNRNPRSRS